MSIFALYQYIHTLIAQPSGAIWGSASCLWTFQHVSWELGIEPQIFQLEDDPLYLSATAVSLLGTTMTTGGATALLAIHRNCLNS